MIDHILPNSPDKGSLVYLIQDDLLHKESILTIIIPHTYRGIYSVDEKTVFGKSKKDCFLKISFVEAIKRIRVKTNSKPCFDNKIMSVRQRQCKIS